MTDTNKLLAALLAALTAANKPTMGKKGASSGIKRNPKFKAKAKPDTTALCIAAFEAKGFKDVQPKVNVMTYKAWVAKGRRVVPGQKGTKAGMTWCFPGVFTHLELKRTENEHEPPRTRHANCVRYGPSRGDLRPIQAPGHPRMGEGPWLSLRDAVRCL